MNWFDIIKNQIASTKGKTFSLDFSQPMVEEDDSCKQKLIDLAKRVESFSKEGYLKDSYAGDKFDKNISEEDCCVAINLFKMLKENTGGWAYNYKNGLLGAWKNNFEDYLGGFPHEIQRYYFTAISIRPHFSVRLGKGIPNDATDEEIEKIGREFKEVSDRLFVL